MPMRINANYNIYGWKVMLVNTYGHEMVYGKFMNSFYGKDKADSELALKHSERSDIIKNTIAFIFPNLSISQRNIGVVAKNFPDSKIYCVDNWVGTEEYENLEFSNVVSQLSYINRFELIKYIYIFNEYIFYYHISKIYILLCLRLLD